MTTQLRPKVWSVPSRLIFSWIGVSKSRIDILEQQNQSVVADSSPVTLKKTVRCLPFVQTRTVQVSPTSSATHAGETGLPHSFGLLRAHHALGAVEQEQRGGVTDL